MRNAKSHSGINTMSSTLSSRHSGFSFAGALTLALGLLAIPFAPVLAQTAAKATSDSGANSKAWVVPRTPDGKPDLQGNWTNETQTPFERMGKQGATLTAEEAKAIEDRAKAVA